MPIEELQGIWRIEESRGWTQSNHPLGAPNSHWLILGERGIAFEEVPPQPLYFGFRIQVINKTKPREIRLTGQYGGTGYFELEGDLLIVTIGGGGVKPPRFEYGCGNYFALTRDQEIEMPAPPSWPRDQIHHPTFGEFNWDATMDEWRGLVKLASEEKCDILVRDDLVPMKLLFPDIELLVRWLQENLDKAKDECAEHVAEWTEEMPGYEHLHPAEIAETISLTSISSDNGRMYAWAGTSIPIDHILRLYFEVEGKAVRMTGVSFEG